MTGLDLHVTFPTPRELVNAPREQRHGPSRQASFSRHAVARPSPPKSLESAVDHRTSFFALTIYLDLFSWIDNVLRLIVPTFVRQRIASRWNPRRCSVQQTPSISTSRYVLEAPPRLLFTRFTNVYPLKSSGPSSFGALAAAFIPTALTATLFIVAFGLIRHRFPKIYSPRTYIGTVPEKDRTPCSNRSPAYWDWVRTMRVVPDKFLLYHQSLDSYLFLRFLRTLIFICVVGVVLTWPVLGAVNWFGGGKSKELNRISIGNVTNPKLLYAHAVVAWVFFSFIMFTVARERLWLIGLRQAWNLSKTNAKRLSSRTVLYLAAPTAALDEAHMQRFFGNDAVRIWPATKSEKLVSLVSSINSNVEELESAEMQLILNIDKEVRKIGNPNAKYNSLPKQMKKSLRPTHKSKTPIVGKEVDSINYYREQIKEKEGELEQARESNENADNHEGSAAVFVEFRTQAAAQQACQQLASSDILSLTPRYTGIRPNEVNWANLNLPPTRRISQDGIALALVIATIIFWTIPIGIVGAISNIEYLAENFEMLSFLNKLPPSLMSLLSGLIPPLLLSALARYVPNIFRCE
jgi:hypothetical protein